MAPGLFRLLVLTLILVSPARAGMGLEEARHLLGRATFAVEPAELETYASLAREQAVNRLMPQGVMSQGLMSQGLMSQGAGEALTPMPAWADQAFISPLAMMGAGEEEKRRFQRERALEGLELRAWWIGEMVMTPEPLRERMTLFWHGHFANGLQKVKSPQLMAWQNRTLRRHALGNFRQLLHAVAKDPAMILYLDTQQSRRGAPNENFAREVMELFTLDEGRYTEQDIREAARAFTGWSLNRTTGAYQFHPGQHDSGSKTVFGKTGPFRGEDILDLILERPETAEFIVTKLWRHFVSPRPDAAEVKRLARVFRQADYEIQPLLKALFTAPAFYAPAQRGALIKSPTDLVVGSLIHLGWYPSDLRPVAQALRDQGQDLFAPPNVKGWPEGDAWITADSLLKRQQFLARAARAVEMPEGMMKRRPVGSARIGFIDLLAVRPEQADQSPAALMQSPEYQLK